MPYLADAYVLPSNRSVETVRAFLEHFAPDRKESAEDYPLPQYGEVVRETLAMAEEIVEYCCLNSSEEYSIYWSCPGPSVIEHAMVFFTTDGGLILGLSTHVDVADEILSQMETHTGSSDAYIMYESPPGATVTEFRRMAREAGFGS